MAKAATSTMGKRESGVELFRIIAMLSIVAHHYVVNSGVSALVDADGFTVKVLFHHLFGMWGKTGINCFVMITGYFMCTSNITLRKFLKLVLEVIFYKAVIATIFILAGYGHFTPYFILNFWPVTSVATGFVAAFILFYLCIPFLNILTRHMTKRQHQQLVALLLFMYTVMPLITIFPVVFNYVSWFCTLYFIASYIRLHGEETVWIKKCNWRAAAVISLVAAFASVAAIVYVNSRWGQAIYPYFFVSDSNKILALTTAVCTFMAFKTWPLAYSKAINEVAATMFGVLLIHAHSNTMRHWLWREVVDVKGFFSTDYYWAYAIGVVLAIFVICIVIDWVRIHTIEKQAFKYIDRYIGQRKGGAKIQEMPPSSSQSDHK